MATSISISLPDLASLSISPPADSASVPDPTSTFSPNSTSNPSPNSTSNPSPNSTSNPSPKSPSPSPPSTSPDPTSPPSSPPLPPHLSHSPATNQKTSAPFQFGSRHLTPDSSVYEFNAWDHVPPSAAHLVWAETQYATQRAHPVSAFDAARFNDEPARWWNRFYAHHTGNFFKDRAWLRQEFPVLTALTAATGEGEADAREASILEVGAGAGNTAFPILHANRNPGLVIHACDFSVKAVELVRAAPEYDERHIRASVWDVASADDALPPGVAENSVDVVLLIFIFSALNPRQWARAVRNVRRVLKPGGEVCFRDYGRGDLAQVRFRKGRWMEENFYVRGDGTRVYFFGEDELRRIWGGEGKKGEEGPGERSGERDPNGERDPSGKRDPSESADVAEKGEDRNGDLEASPTEPVFEIVSLGVDRRLLVNRQKQLQMHRCWMQGRFRKPVRSAEDRDGAPSINSNTHD